MPSQLNKHILLILLCLINIWHPQVLLAQVLKPQLQFRLHQFQREAEENMALMDEFMNCYNTLLAGDLAPPIMVGELEQIHTMDGEEMDITWQIDMVVFSAKKFTQLTGKNN